MILKSPQYKETLTDDLYFTSEARMAWAHLLQSLKLESLQTVLLPAYIGYTEREGSGVFDPIEWTGVGYEFYKVGSTLEADMDDFARLVGSGTVKVALVIHYFGFCQNDIAQMAEICKQHSVLLVEDCAHAFQLTLPQERLGNNGDFSFYSLHKYLATKSGGVLRNNNTSIELPPIPEEGRIAVSVLEQFIKTDKPAVAARRRANYKLYEDYLQDVSGIEIMYELRDHDVPHNFPLTVKNGLRERLYFYLIEKGIVTIALYYRLIDQIKEDSFPVSFQVSGSILNLPVHQDTTEDDVVLICNEIKAFFKQVVA